MYAQDENGLLGAAELMGFNRFDGSVFVLVCVCFFTVNKGIYKIIHSTKVFEQHENIDANNNKKIRNQHHKNIEQS